MLCTSPHTPAQEGWRHSTHSLWRTVLQTGDQSPAQKGLHRSDYLEPFQLGVGSKGGVEPVVWTVEMALAGQLDQDYTHLVSLDAINAFNAMARGCVAQGTSQFAPMLYRVAKWAYNSTTDLVVGDYIIQSSQGVRQGDPLGPLLFSLGARSTLSSLQQHLGPG